MKLAKRTLMAGIALGAAGLLAAAPASAVTDTGGAYTFDVNPDNTATVTGCVGYPCPSTLSIPENVNDGTDTYVVTAIADQAFYYEYATLVTIPDTVQSIGAEAFRYNQFDSIDLPDSLVTLGARAFANNAFTDITIPASTTVIGEGAFTSQGFNLETVTFEAPSQLTTIGPSAFSGVGLSGSVVLPESVTSIGSYAFSSNAIEDFTFPSTLTAIPTGVLTENPLGAGASSTIDIPSTVTTIGDSAFYSTGVGPTVDLPDSLSSLGVSAFTSNALTSVAIPSGLTSIATDAFYDNDITHLTIPSHITELGTYAFGNNPLVTATFLGDEPVMGVEALPTSWFPESGFTPATVTFNVGNTGFGSPTWSPYGALDSTAYPTSPVATVTFNTNGQGTAPADQDVPVGDTATEPAPLTATGHDFLGWSTDAAGTSPWNFASDTVSGPTTLYAQWEGSSYDITFEFGHGLTAHVTTVDHGMTATAPVAPFVSGHRFEGWLLSGAAADFAAPITSALTFEAVYTTSDYSLRHRQPLRQVRRSP
ncbi:leucine-rich repeat protein [Demequina sp. B12]|uniref:leucine-rich repeat protein n=1 Tax=Demequina sp. B12 TaxID=2992757 RepID=UPI00237AE99B|nr:leucine-rich repeat protein [Demequina sp. B12]MDE0573564.1 leucine-rich repeat protein [Demequina sp. B12]